MIADGQNGNTADKIGLVEVEKIGLVEHLLFNRLWDEKDARTDAYSTDHWLRSLLPASFRIRGKDDIVAPVTRDNILTCIAKELDLKRLKEVHKHLWLAGRPMPPRPLHYQLLLGRRIIITEQMDLHLVWTTGQIYLKPIPRFLLEPDFWRVYILPRSDATNDQQQLVQRARGFLFSYAALIAYESDFLIAQKEHLVPKEVEWHRWREFVQKFVLSDNIYNKIDQRFHYGELRLSRLNKIYFLWVKPLSSYMARWNQYAVFFRDNFTWLAGTTVYIAVVLTAMQVGLTTNALKDSEAFHSASYGFTVFSILAPLIAATFIVLAFCCIFVYNWVITIRYKKQRLRHMQENGKSA